MDVEFTSLQRPELLSIGLCTSDGRECYFELALDGAMGRAATGRASTFVRDTVLPQFGVVPRQEQDRAAIGRAVASWLVEIGQAHLVYDYPIDLRLLQAVLRDAGEWARIGPLLRALDVSAIVDDSEAVAAAEESWAASEREGLWRHHALADARALRAMVLQSTAGRATLERQTRTRPR